MSNNKDPFSVSLVFYEYTFNNIFFALYISQGNAVYLLVSTFTTENWCSMMARSSRLQLLMFSLQQQGKWGIKGF